MKRVVYLGICAAALIAFFGSAIVGGMLGRGVLHPTLRALSPTSVQASERILERFGAIPENFAVKARDGVLLRGWKVRPLHANGD
jgi:hypothetical protein